MKYAFWVGLKWVSIMKKESQILILPGEMIFIQLHFSAWQDITDKEEIEKIQK